MFAPLYSEKTNSRPNAPVNIIVGALILKDFTGQTDDEMLESVEFDYRYQYALHTTSFSEQSLSDRTFSRFRERCAAYELTTGEDLIHKCFVSISEEMRKFMDISPNMKCMNSMMIESNIREMERLELLYTCVSNLVKELRHDGRTDLIEGMEHYAEADDRNKVIYHDCVAPQSERLQKVIDDAVALLLRCADDYSDTEEYQLLERAINEQTKKGDHGKNIPCGKGKGMTSSSLQNPADPDATYRLKAGKSQRGYAANLTEAVDEKCSIVTDYQYDVNTRSDSSFIGEEIESTDKTEEQKTIIADGAYTGKKTPKKRLRRISMSSQPAFLGESRETFLQNSNCLRTEELLQNALQGILQRQTVTYTRFIRSGYPSSKSNVKTAPIRRNTCSSEKADHLSDPFS